MGGAKATPAEGEYKKRLLVKVLFSEVRRLAQLHKLFVEKEMRVTFSRAQNRRLAIKETSLC